MRQLAAYIFFIGIVLMAVGQAWPAPLATDLQFAAPGTLRALPGQALGLASEIQVATGEDLESFLATFSPSGGDPAMATATVSPTSIYSATLGDLPLTQAAGSWVEVTTGLTEEINVGAFTLASTPVAVEIVTAGNYQIIGAVAAMMESTSSQDRSTFQTRVVRNRSGTDSVLSNGSISYIRNQYGDAFRVAMSNVTVTAAFEAGDTVRVQARMQAQTTNSNEFGVTGADSRLAVIGLDLVQAVTLPAGGSGEDQTARAAAANAQTTANSAVGAASAAQASADAARIVADAATTPAQAAQQARDVVSDWAETGNIDSIPAAKLLLAPSGGGGGGITIEQATAAAQAEIKPFARTGSTTPPVPADLAPSPAAGRVLGMRTQGSVLHLNWNQLSAGSPHIVLTVDPTADQRAIGGLLPNGGVVLVRATANHPTQLWVRIGPQLTLELFHTFGDPIVTRDTDGDLPAPADYLGRLAVAGNYLYLALGEQGRDKSVTWADYGRTGSGISADELLYAGSFADPPTGNYVINTWAWDRGSEVWIRNLVQNGASWVSSAGPAAYHHGDLYPTRADAERHVTGAGHVNRIYIYGHGDSQKPHIVTAFSAASSPTSEWLALGLTPGQVSEMIEAHNTAATAHLNLQNVLFAAVAAHNTSAAAHADIRTLISSLQAASGVTIGAYSSSSTYARGSSNSIVTHSGGLYMYISATSRSSNHDPGLFPGYWLQLSEGMAYEVITTGAHRISARTIVVDGNNDRVYLCTTTQTTPRDLAYIHAQSQSVGGTFIHLNGGLSTSAVHAQALATNTAEWPYAKVQTFREYGNVVGTDWKQGELTRFGAGNPWYIVNTDHAQALSENPGNSEDYSRLALHSEIPTGGGGGGGVSYSAITGSGNVWIIPAGASFVYLILQEDGIFYDVLYPLAEIVAPPSVINVMVDSFNPGAGATDSRNFIINMSYNTGTRALTALVSSTFTSGTLAVVYRVSAF